MTDDDTILCASARDGLDAAVTWLRELAVAASKHDVVFGARLMVVAEELQAFADRVLPRWGES